MNQQISHKPVVVVLTVFLGIFSILVTLFFKNYDVAISPKPPQTGPIGGCTLEARLCDDGSSVGRIPPTCEFAPCPVAPQTTMPEEGGGGVGTASIAPVMPGESPMAQIPDLPLDPNVDLNRPLTVRYVVEHRTALNDKRITIAGVVFANNLEEKECPPGGMCPAMYMMPSITLSETIPPIEDTRYLVAFTMSEEARARADEYPLGWEVAVEGLVSGSIEGISMSE